MGNKGITGVYKLVNNRNGKVYIGQSRDIATRFAAYKRKACRKQTKLYAALQKYPIEDWTFVVLCRCDVENLYLYEELCIRSYNSVENGYNICHKARGSGTVNRSTRDKISAYRKGKVMSQEQKDKISASLTGKKASEATRKKQSAIRTGRVTDQATRDRISAGTSGCRAGGWKGYTERICTFTGEILAVYEGRYALEREGYNPASVSAVIHNKQARHRGFYWARPPLTATS